VDFSPFLQGTLNLTLQPRDRSYSISGLASGKLFRAHPEVTAHLVLHQTCRHQTRAGLLMRKLPIQQLVHEKRSGL